MGQTTDVERRPSHEAVRSGRSFGSLVVLAAGGVAVVLGLVAVGGLGSRLFGDDTAGGPTSTLFEFVTTDTLPPETTAPVTVATTIPSTTVAAGDFIGQQTGMWLFVGGDGPLRRIDLDTGEVVDFGLEAGPVMSRGGDLVVHLDEPGLAGWISAAAPGEQSLRWHPGPVAPGPEPDLIWLLDLEVEIVGDAAEWQLVDTTTNRILERFPADGPPPADGLPTVSDVTAAVDLPAGRARALLSNPRNLETARSRLADSDDRPVASARFLSEGRWLEVVRLDGGVDLVDVEAGSLLSWEPGATATVSPDGRWLAERGGDQVALFDMTDPGFPDQRRPVRILSDLIDGDERVELLFFAR